MTHSRAKGSRRERQWAKKCTDEGFPAIRAQQHKGAGDSPDVLCASLDDCFQRFVEKVKFGGDDECWEWQAAMTGPGYKTGKGYGAFKVVTSEGTIQNAHRVAWFFATGKSPGKQYVLHKCDNRVCVNPNHLFLGDHAANMKDMKEKGRQLYGERHNMAKITEDDVRRIRRLRARGLTLPQIGSEYGLCDASISLICSKQRWPHVD